MVASKHNQHRTNISHDVNEKGTRSSVGVVGEADAGTSRISVTLSADSRVVAVGANGHGNCCAIFQTELFFLVQWAKAAMK